MHGDPRDGGNERDRPTVIVTAASRGIGAATARHLAARGYRLSLLARSEEVETLARRLGAVACRGSVTEPADLARCVDRTLAAYGRIDGLVCNTGNAPRGDLPRLSDADWQAGAELVLFSAIRLSRLVTPHMEAVGEGSIVHVSSFSAAMPSLRFPVSTVMRAGLAAFMKLHTQEFAARGVRMNAVLPGYMENAPQSTETVEKIPVRRLGAMSELTATIEFLLSPKSGYVCGQQILVDGGLSPAI